MSNLIKGLILLLVVQIGLLAWVHRSGREPEEFQTGGALLDVDAVGVDEVVIDEPGKAPLVIRRQDGRWVLPDKDGFPVSSKQFAGFLEKLLAAESSWPVGTTRVAARQLRVADGEYERRIRLSSKGKRVGQLYLGSSPGFRKVHARLGGAANIHAIDFNAFDAPTNPAEWYDRDFLRLAGADLERIDMGAYALTGGEKGFELEGLGAGERTRKARADEVVRSVTTLSFTDVLGVKGKEVFEEGELILEFTVKPRAGKSIRYTVVSPGEADHYVLKTSKFPYYFTVGKNSIDDLRGVERVQLVEGDGGSTAGQNDASDAPQQQGSR